MRMPKMVGPFLLAALLAGCGDTVGPRQGGNILTNSGFDMKGDYAYALPGDSSNASWIGRNMATAFAGPDYMGDENPGFISLCRYGDKIDPVLVGYATQTLRSPIRAGRFYDVSLSGTIRIEDRWSEMISTTPEMPVRFVAYNGEPAEHPYRWKEKTGSMKVIGQVTIASTIWQTYRTRTRWRADTDYSGFALFIGDSVVHYPRKGDSSSSCCPQEFVLLDTVSLWEENANNIMTRNSLFD